MKRLVFATILFLSVFLLSVKSVYADKWDADDYNGPSVYYVSFSCKVVPGTFNSEYNFTVGLPMNYPDSIRIDSLYAVDSTGDTSLWSNSEIFDKDGNVYYSKITVSNSADIDHFILTFKHSFDNYSTIYQVKSAMHYEVTPTPIPTSTPIPTPTSTPKPTPTNTPIPTPTSTPKPTPTSTPKPTPTNKPSPKPTSTPTPTPLQEPVLELNAYTTSKDAVAQYRTGGFTPVKSIIEFYEVDASSGVLLKVNSEQFLSGSGSMRNNMIPGNVYRYKLTYIYQKDSVQYEKVLWSDDLIIIDQELEDYRSNKIITNFKTLMLFLWESLFELEFSVEGFFITFKDIFVWSMLAILCIWIIREYID